VCRHLALAAQVTYTSCFMATPELSDNVYTTHGENYAECSENSRGPSFFTHDLVCICTCVYVCVYVYTGVILLIQTVTNIPEA
jgi:hypothetical protein